MVTIIAGSRKLDGVGLVEKAVKASGWKITKVISGGARGIDRSAEMWATRQGIILQVMQAQWEKHGRSAGIRRNAEMALVAQALIAIWDGESPGTKNMIEGAINRGLMVYVYYPEAPEKSEHFIPPVAEEA